MIVLKNTQLTKDALYAHDDVVEEIDFDRMERVLHLTVSAWPEYLNYDIFFHGVVGFWMTSCEAWGPDDRIYDIRIENEKDKFFVIPKLFQEEFTKPFIQISNINRIDHLFEAYIEFISGDRLVVACESMEFGKERSK